MIIRTEFELTHANNIVVTEDFEVHTMSTFETVGFVDALQTTAQLFGGELLSAFVIGEDGEIKSRIL